MIKDIYNIFERCDENKAEFLARGRQLSLMRTIAAARGAHPLTLRAIDAELTEIRELLAGIDYFKRITPISKPVVVVCNGGSC